MRGRSSRALLAVAFVLFPAIFGSSTGTVHAAAWPGGDWPLRRSLELISDPHKVDADDTCVAEFYAPGLARADGSDVRVTDENGNFVASRVLMTGPGDRLRLLFNPRKNQIKYSAVWGNAKQAPPAVEPRLTAGLLVETKPQGDGPIDSIAQLKQLYDRSGAVQSRGFGDRPFLGVNPGGYVGASISKITGVLYVPIDGTYQIAMTSDDRGGLMLDGRDFLFAPGFPEDIRFNKTAALKKGPHPLEYYHLDLGGDWRFTIGWKPPGADKVDVMSADAVGRYTKSKIGPLEQLHKETVADCAVDPLGECMIAGRSSFRTRFTAAVPKDATNIRITWDFGDGQTAAGQKVDHVFLSPGAYAIKVALQTIQGSDTRSQKIDIGRDPLRMANPIIDEPGVQCDILSTCDPSRLPPGDVAMLVRILARGKKIDALMPALATLCAVKDHPDQTFAADAIDDAIRAAEDAKRPAETAAALSKLPVDSNVQPKAAAMYADVLLWRLGDFKTAGAMLEPFMARDTRNLKRLRAEALALDGRRDEAQKLFDQLGGDDDPARRAALSGALARSIEYFIDDHQLDTADEKWDDWQRRFPGSFTEGYSAVLKARIIAGRDPILAATVAEAFAKGVPDSPYAPQLLDSAARALAKTDKQRSDGLRRLLLKRYPEDPLSQSQSQSPK